jgi:gamma-glutamylcyclotransferase
MAEEEPEYHFAYGSNIWPGWIKTWAPGVKTYGNAKLPGYRLVFNKKSRDGSGKANIEKTDTVGDEVWGVLYELSEKEIADLDNKEGLNGYKHETLKDLVDDKGNKVPAWAYVATEPIEGLKPYDWYLRIIIGGAIEQDLGDDYIKRLESTPSIRLKCTNMAVFHVEDDE